MQLNTNGKIAENTVYTCELLSMYIDTHGTKGEKGDDLWMSDQTNIFSTQKLCKAR